MLLRVSLDLYLAMYPDSVQHLLLQARLYFHLGIWPEKVKKQKTKTKNMLIARKNNEFSKKYL